MDAADLIAGEKVNVVNVNNGERLETYIIEGVKNSGEITSMALRVKPKGRYRYHHQLCPNDSRRGKKL